MSGGGLPFACASGWYRTGLAACFGGLDWVAVFHALADRMAGMEPNPYESPQHNERQAEPTKASNGRISLRLREMQEKNAQRRLYAGFILFSILAAAIYHILKWYWR